MKTFRLLQVALLIAPTLQIHGMQEEPRVAPNVTQSRADNLSDTERRIMLALATATGSIAATAVYADGSSNQNVFVRGSLASVTAAVTTGIAYCGLYALNSTGKELFRFLPGLDDYKDLFWACKHGLKQPFQWAGKKIEKHQLDQRRETLRELLKNSDLRKECSQLLKEAEQGGSSRQGKEGEFEVVPSTDTGATS